MRGARGAAHRSADRPSGGVARVQHAADAVGRLARQRDLAVRLTIEGRAPVHQLVDVGRALRDENAHRVDVAEPVAGGERVLLVQPRVVVVAHRGGDAALGVAGVALGRRRLGQQEDLARLGERRPERGIRCRRCGYGGKRTRKRAGGRAPHLPARVAACTHATPIGEAVHEVAAGRPHRHCRPGAPDVTNSRRPRPRLGPGASLAVWGRDRPIVVSSPRVWAAVGPGSRQACRACLSCWCPTGACQHLRTVTRVHDALLDARADRRPWSDRRRRRDRRSRRVRRGLLPARPPRRAGADDGRRPGRQRHRRQVGVNHARGKNLIGAFHPPIGCWSIPTSLTTPRRASWPVLYEVVKWRHRRSAAFRCASSAISIASAPAIPRRCCRSSSPARDQGTRVSVDEHETGPPSSISAHAGHAFEAITHYRRFKHGEAVGWDAGGGGRGPRRRAMSAAEADRVAALIDRVGPRRRSPICRPRAWRHGARQEGPGRHAPLRAADRHRPTRVVTDVTAPR